MPHNLEPLFAAAIETLSEARVDYLVYGGIAAGLWGEPRYTEDIDIVIFVPEREFHRFLRAAARHGFHVDEDLNIQQLQVSGWTRIPLGRRDSPLHTDVTLGDSPFDRSAFERRRTATIFGREVPVASPEDLVLYKMISAFTNPERTRDLADVEAVFRRMGSSLDAGHLRKWATFWEGEGIQGMVARVEELVAKWGGRAKPAL